MRDTGKMARNLGLEHIYGQTGKCLQENGAPIRVLFTVIFMKVNGRMGSVMVMVQKYGQYGLTTVNILASGKMINNMVLELRHHLLDIKYVVDGKMVFLSAIEGEQ